MRRSSLLIATIAALLVSFAIVPPASAAPAFRVLVFTKTSATGTIRFRPA